MPAFHSISRLPRWGSTQPAAILRRNPGLLSAPGLHRVARRVRPDARATALPPEPFSRLEGDGFWTDLARNTRGVRIV